jgi:hypothetical protein
LLLPCTDIVLSMIPVNTLVASKVLLSTGEYDQIVRNGALGDSVPPYLIYSGQRVVNTGYDQNSEVDGKLFKVFIEVGLRSE